MGSLFGGGTQTTSQTNAPWAVQQPYMKRGLEFANDALTAKIDAGPYQGGLYAGVPDYVLNAGNRAANYAAGPGQALMGSTALSGAGLLGATRPFLDSATGLATGGIGAADPTFRNAVAGVAANGAQPGVPNDLSSALRNAGVAGAQSLQSAAGTLGRVQTAAMTDPTQHTIDSAGLFANNPALDGAIRAAQSDVNRTLTTQTLPGLGRSASLTGNLNSSRAGAAEAAAVRDAAELNGNIAATMRGQAYANGLNLANDQWKSGLDAATGAATAASTTGNTASLGTAGLFQDQGQFDTGVRLQAGTAGLNADTSRAGTDAQVRLGATGQLGNAVTTGIGAAESAGNQATGLFNLTGQAGAVDQGNQQAQLDAARAQWNYGNGGWIDQALAPYWAINGTPLGSETTTSTTKPSNTLGGLMGLGALALTPYTGGFSFGNTMLGAGITGLFGK